MLVLAAAAFSAGRGQDPWTLTADRIDAANYYGVTVANGMIGVVSSPEPLDVKDVVLAGAYDVYGRGRVSSFVHSFNLLNMRLRIDGRTLAPSNLSDVRQSLDLRHGRLTTTFRYGTKADVRYTYCAVRHLPHVVLMDVEITVHQDLTLEAASVMQAPDSLRDVHHTFNQVDRPHATISLLTSAASSPTGKLRICASTSFIFEEPRDQQPALLHEMLDDNLHLMKFNRVLRNGQTYRFSIVGSLISSAHDSDPLNSAERQTLFARLEGRDRLNAAHDRAWEKLWQSDITIDGDAQAQQDVHSMLYHLYSFGREGTAWSVSPMGLSGLGYYGHVFWDAELWMFPAMLVLHPEIAKSWIEYRYQRIPAARKNAVNHGYKGAMFPWESAGTGEEDTPVWALTGPFEQHITACVGLAAWNYFCVTQDKEWLRERGWPILSATADFWASRVERDEPGNFSIRNVVAADEWAENVDNDAFTNAAAKVNLEVATAAAGVLGIAADPDWRAVADNIPILRFPDGVTREHAGYHGEGIKQADVNLLAYPLKIVTDPVAVRRDLAYYERRVPDEDTPAMTQAIFSLLYARLGDGEKARQFFRDAYVPNLNPPFRVIAETKGGTNPYFATGAGGVLQAVLMGFGGLEITPGGITQVKSALPAGWKRLTLTGIGVEKKTYVRTAAVGQGGAATGTNRAASEMISR